MTSPLLNAVDNGAALNLGDSLYYAAILGTHPSKGARSPVLWNAAFKNLGIDAQMHPMDVTAENLPFVIDELKKDPRFIGGAVTTPHKQTISSLLDALEEEAELIGAVNALYRKDGKLVGANTDGAAALKSLEAHAGSIHGKTVLLLGLGGAGRAVGIYLARAIGKEGKLLLSNRTIDVAQNVQEKTASFCPTTVIPWPVDAITLSQSDILINATTIGFAGSGQEDFSPIDATLMLSLRPTSFVFDLIYQPLESPLLRLARTRGAQTINGKEMNLEQAIIAFEKAARGVGQQVPEGSVKPLMQSV